MSDHVSRREIGCPVRREVDLIFVLDSSSSLSALGWTYVTQYAAAIVKMLPISETLTQFVSPILSRLIVLNI
jgi:hypothetical protein